MPVQPIILTNMSINLMKLRNKSVWMVFTVCFGIFLEFYAAYARLTIFVACVTLAQCGDLQYYYRTKQHLSRIVMYYEISVQAFD